MEMEDGWDEWRIDRFVRKTEMAVTARLKTRYLALGYNIGGTGSLLDCSGIL